MKAILPFLLLGLAAGSGGASAASDMPVLKAERWVNSAPLTAEALRGKVVLVDVWEYTCINCTGPGQAVGGRGELRRDRPSLHGR